MSEVLQQCRGETALGGFDMTLCWQYVEGVIRSSSFTARRLKSSPTFCLPEVYSRKMVRESVFAWVEKNAAYIDMPAHAVILMAMERQYPCKK